MSDPSDDDIQGEGRTVFMPTGTAPGPPEPPQSGPARSEPPPGPTSMSGVAAAQASSVTPGRVEVGAVLNHIYQVTRFIARGGMGEVFEGVNVNAEERVAIKVMLPQLAADPNVQEMFRKEARTLTKLSHPAVVQYRLLAQEPQLGVLYIVTEFIDGASLADVMHQLNAGEAELRMLLRRLAEGLRAAHELGAVHRDISPDNILLPGGRLDRAKIIDFGIAKDLDPSKATIVGDGFAGKLGYVAPEQFGDFDRQIGPWTDVYSLGLVVLAAALGRDVDMGATLVDAIDKRRSGPDLSVAPPGLRPVLERMLKADPAERLRSMEDVLLALDVPPAASPAAAPSAAGAAKTVWAPSPSAAPSAAAAPTAARRKLPMSLIAGGAVLALAVIGLVVLLARPKGHGPEQQAAVVSGGAPRAEVARQAVEAALPGISCSWLDIVSATDQGSGVALKLAGVAGSPSAAQAAVIRAAEAAKAPVADANVDEEVAPVGQPVCTPLDAFRSIRATSGVRRLSTAQRVYQIMDQSDGKHAGRALITLDLGGLQGDFALFGLEPSGEITTILPSQAALKAALANPAYRNTLSDLGSGRYRLQIDTDHRGWSGLLLVSGSGPVNADLISTREAQRGPDWPDRFRQAAADGGWKAEMVWYKTVDQGAR